MQFKVSFATDVGRKRTQNQDNLLALPQIGLFAVADGMGGHLGGETASTMAIQIIADRVLEAQKHPDWDPRTAMTKAILGANSAIFNRACKDASLQGMGTTTTALLFKNDRVVIGHVGDSRCYYLVPTVIWQATRDHSLVQEKLRAGLISRTEARNDPMKNVITRSVGFEPAIEVEIYEMSPRIGDTFMLCSDGLSAMVDDTTIQGVINRNVFDLNNTEDAVRELIQTANNNGGDDNITTIIVRLNNNEDEVTQ
ncbi:MAG: Stp1/IreP family PP2C-type Ser/Thr phosphatase [Bdellovibrionota bacterium]